MPSGWGGRSETNPCSKVDRYIAARPFSAATQGRYSQLVYHVGVVDPSNADSFLCRYMRHSLSVSPVYKIQHATPSVVKFYRRHHALRDQVLFASLRISQRKYYDTKPFCAVFRVSCLAGRPFLLADVARSQVVDLNSLKKGGVGLVFVPAMYHPEPPLSSNLWMI